MGGLVSVDHPSFAYVILFYECCKISCLLQAGFLYKNISVKMVIFQGGVVSEQTLNMEKLARFIETGLENVTAFMKVANTDQKA